MKLEKYKKLKKSDYLGRFNTAYALVYNLYEWFSSLDADDEAIDNEVLRRLEEILDVLQ